MNPRLIIEWAAAVMATGMAAIVVVLVVGAIALIVRGVLDEYR